MVRPWLEVAKRATLLLLGAALLMAPGPSCAPPIHDPAATAAVDEETPPVFDLAALPGAPPRPAELTARLAQAIHALDASYVPRTDHVHPNGRPKFTNRLILESSPYLRQHAHNPVDWHSWGSEAMELARKLDRPILLSVGYSTCHWCHVMERESFEDEEIARTINDRYVAIKVDREERPDVDAVYMAAVQALTGRGGWPMTVWMTPDAEPFYAGTYFPARDGDRGSATGFLTLLTVIADQYAAAPEQASSHGQSLAAHIRERMVPGAAAAIPGIEILDRAAVALRSRFDPVNGGTTGAPKFPSNLPVRLMLRQHRRTGEAEWLRIAERTLEGMARGGLHDQVGGGFHRYSTDAHWLVPHFEKMLYDNALLASAYLEGWQATGRDEFAEVARRLLSYVELEMTAPEGGFYSATDADSLTPSGHAEEGWYFTWTLEELTDCLGREQAGLIARHYGVTRSGNFEGRSVLHVAMPVEALAREAAIAPDDVRGAIDEARSLLWAARARRPAPLLDDKVLTAWNGLMISAFAQGSVILGEPRFAATASRAASFVLDRMRVEGRLRRSYKDGAPRHNAYLDDYAFLIAGLLDLHEATGERRWLGDAIELQATLDEHHLDRAAGGYFATSHDHEPLLAREKPTWDGAEPSGNSITALNLLRFSELTSDDRYRSRADALFRAFATGMNENPLAASELLAALDFRLGTPKEIVLIAARSRDELKPFRLALARTYLPNRIVIEAIAGSDLTEIAALAPIAAGKTAIDGGATAYVCESGSCDLPARDVATFERQIRNPGPPATGR